MLGDTGMCRIGPDTCKLVLTLGVVFALSCSQPVGNDNPDNGLNPPGSGGSDADDPDGGDSGSDNGSPGDPGNPGDGDGAECSLDLNGYWIEHASQERQVLISHEGSTVFAQYVDEPNVCDHHDGTGETSETSVDFQATLSGCTFTGQIMVCQFGCTSDTDPPCMNGFVDVDFEGTVSESGDHIEGTWINVYSATIITVTFDRLPCRQKTADEYGLPSDLEWMRVASEGEIQYRASAPEGSPPLALNAGVAGTVVAVITDILPPQVHLELPNGNLLAYLLLGDGSAALVNVGDGVESFTPIASLAREASTGRYALTLIGFDSDNQRTDPDCVEGPM